MLKIGEGHWINLGTVTEIKAIGHDFVRIHFISPIGEGHCITEVAGEAAEELIAHLDESSQTTGWMCYTCGANIKRADGHLNARGVPFCDDCWDPDANDGDLPF